MPDVQPHSRPFSATSSSGTTPAVSSAAPTKSIRPGTERRGSVSFADTTASAASPIGTLT